MDLGNAVMVIMVALLLTGPAVYGFWQATQMGREAEKRMDRMQAEIDDLRESRDADHEEMRDLRDGIGLLVEQIRRASMEPVWTPDMVKRKPRTGAARLATFIAEKFNNEELNALIFEMGETKDRISGETVQERAREVVKYFEARGRLTELRSRVNELRPK